MWRFDSAPGTMICHRLLAAVGLVALSSVVMAVDVAVSTPPIVEAQTGACSSVIPVDAMAGSIMGHGASGVFAAGTITAGSAGLAPVVAGGAAPVIGPTAAVVGGGLFIAAIFLSSVYGTCKFIDWQVGDGNVQDDLPLFSQANTTLGPWEVCTAMFGAAVPPGTASTDRCRRVMVPSALPSLWVYGDTRYSQTSNGVTVPGADFSVGGYGTLADGAPTTKWLSHQNTWCNAYSPDPWPCSDASSGQVVTIKYGCVQSVYGQTNENVGGWCGIHPQQQVLLGRLKNSVAGDFNPVVSLIPELRDQGWTRRIVTDINCFGDGGGWVRAESPTYTDRSVSARIPVPVCAVGTKPITIRSWRLPLNVECAVGSASCWSTNSPRIKIYEWNAPATFTDGTAPEIDTCLTVGSVCGGPVLNLQTNTCMWGANVVNATYCDPTRQTGTGTDPNLMPKPEPTVTPKPHVVGTPTATVQPIVEPGPTPTTLPGTSSPSPVPIDPGTGLGTGTQSETQAECWPDGWGWFNPGQWVLRPIQCAVSWAFIPSGPALALRLDRFNTLRDAPPVQWADAGVAWVGDASFVFARWSVAGPACTDIMDTAICPRDWDNPAAVPGWILGALTFGLWSLIVFAVWRWF